MCSLFLVKFGRNLSVSVFYRPRYALLFVFNMQTAMEMHRAWNMTLLTSKTLKKCSEMVGLTMTWELGVIKLKFFMEDNIGGD